MAKMLKHLVFGQRKNPPAPPRPDYDGDKLCAEEGAFSEHDYENISKFRCQVQFEEQQKELLVFENYSEPADLLSEIEEDVYVAPLDDCCRPSAPPQEEVYCVPYDAPQEDATYDIVPEDDGEYDEPWEWRLSPSQQVSPSLEEDEAMRRQRRLVYETAFDSRVSTPDEGGGQTGAESSRAASRSSFGSSTGSSASSTPTHRHQRITVMQGGGARSASPPQSRPPLNQNFERKISFSPQWCCPQEKSASQEQGAKRVNQDTMVDRVDPEHQKENKESQSPENDVRPCVDYDLPWDTNQQLALRVNGSKSVPEKLSEENTQEEGESRPRLSLGCGRGRRLTLDFGCSALGSLGEKVDPQLSLEKQGWYHGSISRVDAESKLRVLKEGSYLVRNSESSRQDYSLSLKSARGFMHMKIVVSGEGRFVLGQFSNPFSSIPEMIQHYSRNKLPIKGAEHMSLLHPCIDQLL